tara:strand:+ start:1457 stop:1747 length:291 start_codon:yes stop_codon:yes gene_type:complete
MIKTVNVTQEDINNGEPRKCNNCAISQALKRIFKAEEAYTDIIGGDVVLTVNKKKYQIIYEADQSHECDVLDFIHDFDEVDGWSKAKPISFKIIEV